MRSQSSSLFRRTEASLFNETMMARKHSNTSSVLVVEGEDEDAVLSRHVKSNVSIIGVGGKETAISLAKRIHGKKCDRIYVLVDRDFDEFLFIDVPEIPEVLLQSDLHDSIMDLACSDAGIVERSFSRYERLIEQNGAEVHKLSLDQISKLTRAAFEIALILSAFRIVSLKYSLHIRFKEVDFTKLLLVEDCFYDIVEHRELVFDSQAIQDLADDLKFYSSVGIPSDCVKLVSDHVQQLADVSKYYFVDHDLIRILQSFLIFNTSAEWFDVKQRNIKKYMFSEVTTKRLSQARWCLELSKLAKDGQFAFWRVDLEPTNLRSS